MARRQSSSIGSVHVEAEATISNAIKFGDVQDALPLFTGDGHCSVVKLPTILKKWRCCALGQTYINLYTSNACS